MAKKTDGGYSIDDILADLRDKRKMEVHRLADDDSPCVVAEFISTGCLALDYIMGGGIPVGRLTELHGDPSSGKSLIAGQVAAEAQADDVLVHYCDPETSVSRGLFKKLGVDDTKLIYSVPENVEQVFELADYTVELSNKTGQRVLFIWDSVAATTSKAEEAKDYGETGYLTQARVISQAMRKLMPNVALSKAALLFLNQNREAIGVMYGDRTTQFGGKAIPYHASVRIELSIGAKIKSATAKNNIKGVNLRAVCTKNKVVAPYRTAELPVYFGHGISDAGASLIWLKDNGYVTVAGAWYTLDFGGEEVRFQRKGWGDIYNQHYESIAEVMTNRDEDDQPEDTDEEDKD